MAVNHSVPSNGSAGWAGEDGGESETTDWREEKGVRGLLCGLASGSSILKCYSKCGPETSSISLPGSLLEMRNLGPQPALLNPTLGGGLQESVL